MKSLNNKTLVIILAALVAVFVLSRVFRSPQMERNLPDVLVKTDTSAVDVIRLFPKNENGALVEFRRDGRKWSVKMGDRQSPAEPSAVAGMLNYLSGMKPARVITGKQEKWKTYEVGDSATHVVALSGDDVLAEAWIGKTDFTAAAGGGPQNPFGGGGFGNPFTYVRVSGNDQVYTVDGFLEPAFNRTFSDWRDKALIRIRQTDVTGLRFDYPDSAFTAELRNGKWMIDGGAADSTAMRNFISSLEFRNATGFADDFQGSTPSLSIQISGAQGALAVLKAWNRERDYVISTSRQPGTYFTIDKGDVLFARKSVLTGKR